MTILRFAFQRECALFTPGKVLNVGCKEDPAGLKALRGEDVINLDRWRYNIAPYLERGELVPIAVDVVHDATDIPWPFPDDSFGMVVLGDILEDLPDDGCQLRILTEARRISTGLCITVPEDVPERDAHHLTTVTEERLRGWLFQTGWTPEVFEVVNYETVPRGYFVRAVRNPVFTESVKSMAQRLVG